MIRDYGKGKKNKYTTLFSFEGKKDRFGAFFTQLKEKKLRYIFFNMHC